MKAWLDRCDAKLSGASGRGHIASHESSRLPKIPIGYSAPLQHRPKFADEASSASERSMGHRFETTLFPEGAPRSCVRCADLVDHGAAEPLLNFSIR